MARRLSFIETRTSQERYGTTRGDETAQAMLSIFKTIGQAEKVRRDRQTLDRVTRAIAGGKTTIQAIADAAMESPDFSTGLRGALQKFGGMFQPPGGAGQDIQQSIIGGALQQALTPTDPYGKPPWWVRDATQEQIEDYRGRVGGPLIQMGERLLTPEQRKILAEAEFERKLAQQPLTPTEQKGIKATVVEIVGEKMAKLKGILPGAYFSQEDMSKKWEDTMEATGYAGRSKVQQKQIENEFDRYVAMLNKGKGTTTFANQYQWNRKKYVPQLTQGISEVEQPAKFTFSLDALNQVYKNLPPEKKPQFEMAWKRAKKAGATQEEFLREWLR